MRHYRSDWDSQKEIERRRQIVLQKHYRWVDRNGTFHRNRLHNRHIWNVNQHGSTVNHETFQGHVKETHSNRHVWNVNQFNQCPSTVNTRQHTYQGHVEGTYISSFNSHTASQYVDNRNISGRGSQATTVVLTSAHPYEYESTCKQMNSQKYQFKQLKCEPHLLNEESIQKLRVVMNDGVNDQTPGSFPGTQSGRVSNRSCDTRSQPDDIQLDQNNNQVYTKTASQIETETPVLQSGFTDFNSGRSNTYGYSVNRLDFVDESHYVPNRNMQHSIVPYRYSYHHSGVVVGSHYGTSTFNGFDLNTNQNRYIADFQRKPGNCSFKQAAVTRFSLKSDDIEDSSFNTDQYYDVNSMLDVDYRRVRFTHTGSEHTYQGLHDTSDDSNCSQNDTDRNYTNKQSTQTTFHKRPPCYGHLESPYIPSQIVQQYDTMSAKGVPNHGNPFKTFNSSQLVPHFASSPVDPNFGQMHHREPLSAFHTSSSEFDQHIPETTFSMESTPRPCETRISQPVELVCDGNKTACQNLQEMPCFESQWTEKVFHPGSSSTPLPTVCADRQNTEVNRLNSDDVDTLMNRDNDNECLKRNLPIIKEGRKVVCRREYHDTSKRSDDGRSLKRQYPIEIGSEDGHDGTSVRHVVLTPKRRRLEMYRPWSTDVRNSIETSGEPNKLSLHGGNIAPQNDRHVNLTYKRKLETRTSETDSNIMDLSCSDKSKEETGSRTKHLKTTEICEQKLNVYNGHGKQEKSTSNKRKAVRDRDQLYKVSHVNLDIRAIKRTLGSSSKRTTDIQTNTSMVSSIATPLVNGSPILSSCAERPIKTSLARKALFRAPGNDRSTVTDHQNATNLQKHSPTEPYKVKSALQKLIRNKQRAESKVKRQKELLKLVGKSIKMRKAQNVPQNKSSVSLVNVSNGLTELSPNMEDKSNVHPKLRHKIPKSSDEDFQEKLEESLGPISDEDIFGAKHVDASDKTIEKSDFMKVFGLGEILNMTERKSPTENQRYESDLNDAYIIDIESSHNLNTDENNNSNNENLKIQRTFSFDRNESKEMKNNIDRVEHCEDASFDDCHVSRFDINNPAEQVYNTQSPINTCYSVQALHGPMVSSTYFKEGTKDNKKSRVIRHARENFICYSNVDEYPHHTAACGGPQEVEEDVRSTENQQESPIVLPDLVIDTSSQKSSLDSSPNVNTLSIPHKETEFVDTRERRNDVKQDCYSTEDSDISAVNDDHAVGSSVSKCDSTDIMDGQNLSYDKYRAEQVANYATGLQHETNQNLWLEMHVKYMQTKQELADLDNHRAFLPPLPAFAPTYMDPSHSDPGVSVNNGSNISRYGATQEDFERYRYHKHQKQQHLKFASPVSYEYTLDNHGIQDHSPFCLQPTNDVAPRQNPSCSSLPTARNIVSVPSLYNCDSTTQTYDEMINDVSSTVMFETNIVQDLEQVIEEVVSNTCDNPGSPDLISLVTDLETLSEERLDYNGTGSVKPEIPKYRYNDDLDSEIENPQVRQHFEQLCHGITHRHRYSKRLPSFYSRAKHDKHAHEMELFKAANKFLGDFDGSHKRACRKEIKEATVTERNDEKEKDENVKIMKQKASQTDSRKSIAKALHTIAERKRMKNARGRKKLNNAEEEENKRGEKNKTPDAVEKLKMSELLKKCKTKTNNFNKRFSKHGKMFSMRAHFDKKSRQKFVKKDDKIDKTLFIKVETLKGEDAMMASNKGTNETRKDDKSTENKTGKDDKPMEKNQSLLSSSETSVSTSNQSSAAAATSAALTSIPKPGVPCKVCNVLLDRDEKKQDEHYQKYHKGWCKKCQKDFGDNVQRRLHVRRNHDIRIFCGLCGVTFLYRGSYIKHTKCQMHIENCKKFPNNQQKTELEKPTPQPNPDLNESVISISSETSTEDLSIHYISSCSEDVLFSPEKTKQVKQDRKEEKTVKGPSEKMVAAKQENKVSKLPVEKKATKKVKKVNKVSSGHVDTKKGDGGQEESKTVKGQTDELKSLSSKAKRNEWPSSKPKYCETCDHFYKKLKQHMETEKHLKTLAQKKKEMRLKKKEEKLRRQEMEGSQTKEKKPSLKQGKSGKGQMTNTNKKLRIRKYIYRHRCPHCDKLLPDRWKLDAHVRSHTGEAPYKCDVCVKSFKVKRSLEAHYIRHHSNMQLENNRNKEK